MDCGRSSADSLPGNRQHILKSRCTVETHVYWSRAAFWVLFFGAIERCRDVFLTTCHKVAPLVCLTPQYKRAGSASKQGA